MARGKGERQVFDLRCEVCGKSFQATRSDARFDSSTCRSRAMRAGRVNDHVRTDAEWHINKLIAQMRETGDNADVGALKRLRRLMDEAITAVESV